MCIMPPDLNVITNNAAKGGVFWGGPMMEFLGALVVIGIFVIWCDLTGAWNNVLRPIHARLPAYSKQPPTAP